MTKRKMWKGRDVPDGVVGIGKNGAMPVPSIPCQCWIEHAYLVHSLYLCRGIGSISPC